jgi:hypothetical protein
MNSCQKNGTLFDIKNGIIVPDRAAYFAHHPTDDWPGYKPFGDSFIKNNRKF